MDRKFYLFCLLFPVTFFIGLKPVYIQFFVLISVIFWITRLRTKIYIPHASYFLFALLCTYPIPIIIHYKLELLIRFIGSLNHFSLLFCGTIFFLLASNLNKKISVNYVYKGFIVLCWYHVSMVIIGTIFWIIDNPLTIQSLLLHLYDFGFSKQLVRQMQWSLFSESYIFSMEFVRISGLEQVNIASGYVSYLLLILVAGIDLDYPRRIHKILILLLFYSAFISLGRIPLVLSLFIVIGYFLLKFLSKKVSLIVLVSICLLIAVVFFPILLEQRPGSAMARMEIYERTIEWWRGNEIIGIGYKPRVDDLAYPIGSHSQILGLLLRAGLIGAFLFLCFHLISCFKWFKTSLLKGMSTKGYFLLGLGACLSTAMLFFHDVDAYPFVTLFYFSIIGLIFNKQIIKDGFHHIFGVKSGFKSEN
jgi:hypothetical protein